MKKTAFYVAAALVLSASTNAIAQKTGDEIINKHIEAIGGAAWNNVKSIKMAGSASAMGMEIPMDITVVDGKAMRTNMTVMGMEGYIIVSGQEGWMYMPFQPGYDKVTPLPADQLQSMSGRMSIKSMQLADKSQIASATLAGMDTLDNVPCYKVTVKDKDNSEQTAYFDANTYYMVRTERKVKQKDEEQEVAVSFSNFQKLPQGVVVPMVQSNPMMGGDITFKKVEVNPTLSDSYFKPEASKTDDQKGSGTKKG